MEECSKFGIVVDLKIPRPVGGSRQSAGVGKIFVKFDTPETAKKALEALAGRKFADRTVVTTYFPEVSQSFHSIIAYHTADANHPRLQIGELRCQCMVDRGIQSRMIWCQGSMVVS